jgi:hypothetical protein
MSRRVRHALLALALVCLPAAALAQTGNISGTVRDAQGAVVPGVTVEVSSPQLIEKVRSATTDNNGRYQITSLPVGVYKVTFTLTGFATVEHSNVELSTDFTAPVNAEMKVGGRTEVVTVIGTSVPLVDVQNARQRQVFTGDEVADLPTTRNLGDLVQLVPGIAISGPLFDTNSTPTICAGGQGQGNQSGAASGCSPIFQGFNAHSSMNDPDSINQGRMQVDGMGINSFGGGGRSSYISDVGNAQEITLTLSGALGESETGGTTINVIPRTGGNRYAGNYFTAYSSDKFYGKNDGVYSQNGGFQTFENRLIHEYDVNGAYGGPIKRDRLWFYSAARRQSRESRLFNNFRNVNEGVFGANYVWNPDAPIFQSDLYQNVNARITLQASRRDKVNFFWDEQYTCENPCKGADGGVSVEASDSNLTHPLRVMQVSWTNPLTSKILLDAGFSRYSSNRDETRNFYANHYPGIPRIAETGATVNSSNATPFTSGSLNNSIFWQIQNIQSRASASYVTGSHNFKVGYQGQLLSQVSTPSFNDLRLNYAYATPAATCTPTPAVVQANGNASTWCGLLPDGRRAYDGLPQSAPLGPALPTSARPPIPTSITQYIPSQTDQSAFFAALYVQDQWTLQRLTLNGALRWDNATSHFGKTCVGPDLYTPLQYCLNDPANGDSGKGVDFKDITPRWGVAYDVFGNGKTAIKYSMGKYLQGAQVGGIYTASNAAAPGRTVNSYSRVWRDLDGDRVVDCDLTIPVVAPGTGGLPPNGECGGPSGLGVTAATARRFGRSPDDLDDLGLAIGLGTIYCGIDEPSMAQAARNYCQNYFNAGGSSLLDGWNKRQYEWQWSLGVQHQILPRLSGELTFNQRKKYNLTASDAVGSGCDLYSSTEGGTTNAQQCMQDLLNFISPFYDFYGVQAPLDPRLPGGGGYVVDGFATQKIGVTVPAAQVTVVTLAPDGAAYDDWSGVDTNFVWRAASGLRVSGGTSTGRRNVGSCGLLLSDPPGGQVLMEGRERDCDRERIFQTNVRGTASYTIPWIDLLVSSTFSVRPGTQINATYTVDIANDLIWAPNSQSRKGTTFVNSNATTVTPNLLSNDTYGERITLFDVKFAKNVRFMGKRVNIGVDVYNIFNSDASLAYCGTFPNPARGIEGCGTAAANNLRDWRSVQEIVAPRYARFQIRADF